MSEILLRLLCLSGTAPHHMHWQEQAPEVKPRPNHGVIPSSFTHLINAISAPFSVQAFKGSEGGASH